MQNTVIDSSAMHMNLCAATALAAGLGRRTELDWPDPVAAATGVSELVHAMAEE